MSGTSLDDRCTPFRGSTVPLHTVLNLSDRQLIAGSKGGGSARSQPQPLPLRIPGYGAPVGPNGKGQLKPAAPPVPLRGSFRGAVAGSSRGSQARVGVIANQQRTAMRGKSAKTSGGECRCKLGRVSNGSSSRTWTIPSLTRGGYHKLDDGPTESFAVQNNPNFTPKSYANVPPPTTLDPRGRGRGGRARPSRGVAPRGRGPSQNRAAAVIVQQN